MARAGILFSQVAQAASQLAAQGKNPTIDTVRDALGGTGSKSTIAPMLKRWKAEHQNEVVQVETGVPHALLQAVKSLYEHIQLDAQQQIAAANEAHEQALAAQQARLDAAQTERTQLLEEKEALAQTLKHTQEALAACQLQLQDKVVALGTAQTENTGLAQRLADKTTQVNALLQQLSQTRDQFDHFQEATANQRAQAQQAHEQHTSRLEQELIELRRRCDVQQTTLAQQAHTLTQQAKAYETLQQTQQESQATLTATRTERDQLQAQNQEIALARANAEQRLAIAQQAVSVSSADAAAASKQAEMLSKQLAAAEQKLAQLTQEQSAWMERLLAQTAQKQQKP